MNNTLKTVALLGLLSGLLLAVGGAIGGRGGLTVALVLCAVMNLASWWFSDRIVLAMHGAQSVPREQAPDLYRVVEDLAASAQIPMPRVCIINGDAPNAFATGRNPSRGVVAITRPLLGMLDETELRGVLAHEMGHIKNRDTLTMAVAATLAAAVMYMANMLKWGMIFGGGDNRRRGEDNVVGVLLTIILAPLAAMLIQAAISRSREFEADATGAKIAHGGFGLASALEKLEGARDAGYALPTSPATAHLFIVNPLRGRGVLSLFSTHPPAEERILRLRQMRV